MSDELVQIDRAFRAGLVVPPHPPSRFYVNLVETCNVRCAHCITRAPELTADGTGRAMTREVLDRLAPHLAHALYVGLTHAGEPTTAPMLVPLLEALRTARGNEPYVVHLLTNGQRLDVARFEALTALGVSSWSFSVDGLSAITHDRLRVGSNVDRLLERIEALARVRTARSPYVRLGVAWTVTRSNAAEVPALVRWAHGAGLDWVKLEEVFPINDVARREELPPDELARVVRAASTEADALGLPLLDHTKDVQVWKCQLDRAPEMARFSRLDDRVNRQEINGCRFPWEVVCVEPNGDVRPMSFAHPIAGNLVEDDLAALWREPRFILERTRSMLARPCGRGPVVCGADPGPAGW